MHEPPLFSGDIDRFFLGYDALIWCKPACLSRVWVANTAKLLRLLLKEIFQSKLVLFFEEKEKLIFDQQAVMQTVLEHLWGQYDI